LTALLEIEDLHSGYRGRAVIHGVSFHVNRGSFVCLLGPSGCGKTTILRVIAGFERVYRGRIVLDGRVVARSGLNVPPERRRVGMVFQENTLFPHLTVAENVAFGLHRGPAAARRHRLREMLEVVGLEAMEDRYPHELSGGQQQRVALARALAPEPALMLLDEPFSSLDVDLRERLGTELRDVLKARGITTVLVTHDQNEAFSLSDQIGVLSDGRMLQWDTPYNLYHEPADRFIADFIGRGIFLRGRLLAPDAVETELGVIRGNRAYNWPAGSEVDVLLRPDDVQPAPESAVAARVVGKVFKGAEILYSLELETGNRVLSMVSSHEDYPIGETIGIRVAADHLVAFRA